MYTTRACIHFFLLLLSSSLLAIASAAPPPSVKPSYSIPTASDGILEQPQNSTAPPPSIPLLYPINVTLDSQQIKTDVPTIVPVPGTDVYLMITYISESWLETSLLESFFTDAHERIQETLATHADDPIAPIPWFYGLYDSRRRETIAIRIRDHQGKIVTWRQLDSVLTGLLMFMGGRPRELHPVNFDVNVVNKGKVAVGVLWYSQVPPLGTVDKGSRGRSD